MANEIYTKVTTLGSDDCIILDAKNSFKKQFPMGDDWTHICVGSFISYTASLTQPNIGIPDINSLTSAGNTKDTYSYIGASRWEAADSFLPETGVNTADATESYIGYRFKTYTGTQLGRTGTATTGGMIGNRYDSNATVNGYFQVPTPQSSSDAVWVFGEEDGMARPSEFAFYIGFNLYKSSSSTNLAIKHGTSGTVGITDVSLDNLRNVIDTNVITSSSNAYLNLVDYGAVPIGYPDSFFFYNAFPNARMRIHAMAVKKLA
jgi:hypothetical protein